jgi:hypothetical protein
MTPIPFWTGITFWLVWWGVLIWFAPGWWRSQWPARVAFVVFMWWLANCAEYWGY